MNLGLPSRFTHARNARGFIHSTDSEVGDHRLAAAIDQNVGRLDVPVDDGFFEDVYSFSPNTIAVFRFSYMRFGYDRRPGTQGQDLTALGLPANLNVQIAKTDEMRVRLRASYRTPKAWPL
jgi:hypothetical protein